MKTNPFWAIGVLLRLLNSEVMEVDNQGMAVCESRVDVGVDVRTLRHRAKRFATEAAFFLVAVFFLGARASAAMRFFVAAQEQIGHWERS